MKILGAAVAATVAIAASGALGQTVEEFYSGKTVTVVAPSGTGGSIYKYALLVSNHIGRHIPGQPDVVVEDRPGGGGVRGASYVFNAAAPDGLVIAEVHPSSLLVPLTKDVGYNFADANFLGSIAVRPYVGAVWHTVDLDRLEDLGDEPLVFAGVGGSSTQFAHFVSRVTGKTIKVISGYAGGGEMNLAMERGEVQGRGNYYEGFLATNPDWIEEEKIRFIYRLGVDVPDLEGVPHVSSWVEGEEDTAMLGLLEAALRVGQAFYVAPDVPEDRVEALRTAFAAMLEDPEFLAEAESFNLVIRSRTPEEVSAIVAEAMATSPEIVALIETLGK